MTKQKKTFKHCIIACIISFLFLPVTFINMQAASYEIVFKSGLHGTMQGEKSVSYQLEANQVFPNEPDITVEEGYVFKGWNKELPEVGSPVEGKQVFVAKYATLVSGVQYTVHYVDENKIDIATPKTIVAEENTEVQERAKTVPGYAYQETIKKFTVSKATKEIFFIYTLTNSDEVIRYEEAPNNNQNNGTGQNANGNQDNGQRGTGTDTGDDDKTGEKDREQQNVEDNDTPLANGKKRTDMMKGILMAALAIVLLIIILLIYKKKQQNANKKG